ncbi:MAG: FAD-dependent oxidoreductase [Actinomycetota bacterium]|nr:FAD-dependent oxidoreductase [Actinomycetota bacterium]
MTDLAVPRWCDELPAGADVVVVGAGIVGTAVAARLATAGADVCLLERSAPAAGTSSSGEGNLLVSDKLPGAELALAMRSLALWQELDAEAAHGIELERKGGLVVARDAAQLAALYDLAAAQEGAGVSVQRLEGADLADVEPHLSAQLAGALFYEDDAQVQPMLAVAHQLARAAANGCCCMVRGAEARGWHDLPRGTRALETTLGSLRVGTAVVNAAGPWAGELAARLGSDLPLAPRRGHVLVTEPVPVITAHKVYEADYVGSIHSADEGWRCSSVVESTQSGTMLLGSSRELAGWSTLPIPEIVATIAARAISLFPGLAGVRLLRTYVGFRPATPDRLPAIGWDARVPGLLHATGHEGAGIGLSLATAEALQCLLEKTTPPVELEPFDPARFSSAEERVTRA